MIILGVFIGMAGCTGLPGPVTEATPASMSRSADHQPIEGEWRYTVTGSRLLHTGVLVLNSRAGGTRGRLIDNNGRVNATVSAVTLEQGVLHISANAATPDRIVIEITAQLDGPSFAGTIRINRVGGGSGIDARQEAARITGVRQPEDM